MAAATKEKDAAAKVYYPKFWAWWEASKKSNKLYNDFIDHVGDCDYCFSLHLEYCPTAQNLVNEWTTAQAKTTAAAAEKNAAYTPYAEAADKEEKAKEKVKGLEEDIQTLEKAREKPEKEYTELTGQLSAVCTELYKKEQRGQELEERRLKFEALEVTAPGYLESLHKAARDGVNLGQWEKDNPPPDGFEEVIKNT